MVLLACHARGTVSKPEKPVVPAREQAIATAPAGIGNLAVGFDILGQALAEPQDRVTVAVTDVPGVTIKSISGVVTDLPRVASKNSATAGIERMLAERNAGFGVQVSIEKGISLGSGMGGSAASAVAGVTAAAALFEAPFAPEDLLTYALDGEQAATGTRHADNVAAAICGGVTLVLPADDRFRMRRLAMPEGLYSVLVHPHQVLETRASRAVIPERLPMAEVIGQMGHLAGFLTACQHGDIELLRDSLRDVLIEPYRAKLLPGFDAAKVAALDAGALGCSISGGGPSVFAWCFGQAVTLSVADAMQAAYRAQGIAADRWISPVDTAGARLLN